MRKTLINGITALIIVLGSSCAAVQPQASAECAQYSEDIKTILPAFSGFGSMNGRCVQLLNSEKAVIGSLLLAPAGKRERVEGYNDVINTAVVVTPDNKIIGVVLGENSETPRFLQRLKKAGFLYKWNNRTPAEAADLKVDAVTRCTYSSNAVKAEVSEILRSHK